MPFQSPGLDYAVTQQCSESTMFPLMHCTCLGKQQVHAIQVAVKMSFRVQLKEELLSPPLLTDELARDLAVISGLPHQNILTLHGVCESKTKKSEAASAPTRGQGQHGGAGATGQQQSAREAAREAEGDRGGGVRRYLPRSTDQVV